MGGICGLYQRDGLSVEHRTVLQMAQQLALDGTYEVDISVTGPIGLSTRLGDARLAARPPNASASGAEGRFILAADARIDNRDDLLQRLGWANQRTAAVSDEQLIAGSYERWGRDCVDYLVGDFAFALWDAREKLLLCVRDCLGVRPLYYAFSDTTLAFASDIKALLTLPWVSRRPNETRIADHLMQVHEDVESTFFEGVHRLPPAHTLTVSQTRIQRQRYWSVDVERETRFESDEMYEEVFRNTFVEAVRCRLRSGSPVGVMLSGGFDSSSVTCVARKLVESGRQHLDTFSFVFPDVPDSDESEYIESVLNQGGFRPHYVYGDRLNPFATLDQSIRQTEEPVFTPNLYLYWALYQEAKACGVRTVLDGFAGDHVVSHGTGYLTELAMSGRWIRLLREMNLIATKLATSRQKAYRYLLREFVLAPMLTEPLKRRLHSMSWREPPSPQGTRYVNMDLIRRVGWTERARALERERYHTRHTVKAEHAAELRSSALPGVFEILYKSAACFGVTPSFPFADRRMVEYCLSVPVTQKYRDGWTRAYARDAMSDYLPEMVRLRYGKRYLHHSLYRSLFHVGQVELKACVYEGLSVADAFVNVHEVQHALHQLLNKKQQRVSRHDVQTIQSIWSAVALARWLAHKPEAGGQSRTPTRSIGPH